MTTLFKLRKSPRPPQCDATRCDEEGANNLTGEMWRRPTVRLCARHTSMVLAFQDKHPDYVPDGEEQTPEPLPTSVTALVPAGITLANQTVLGAWVERVRGIAAELPGLLAEGTSVLEYAKEYVIGTHAELVEASAFLLEVKSTNNAIASKKKEITAPLSGALAKVRELLKPAEQVWVDAEAILRAKTEAAALHEAERNRLAMQAASEAHAGGQDVSGALARLTTSSDLEGVTFKVFWKAIVEDVSLLPNEFVVRIPNQLKLKEHCAKAGDSEPEPIAGVRFEKDATSRVQSKKT